MEDTLIVPDLTQAEIDRIAAKEAKDRTVEERMTLIECAMCNCDADIAEIRSLLQKLLGIIRGENKTPPNVN